MPPLTSPSSSTLQCPAALLPRAEELRKGEKMAEKQQRKLEEEEKKGKLAEKVEYASVTVLCHDFNNVALVWLTATTG